jgi:hypothetical protein
VPASVRPEAQPAGGTRRTLAGPVPLSYEFGRQWDHSWGRSGLLLVAGMADQHEGHCHQEDRGNGQQDDEKGE